MNKKDLEAVIVRAREQVRHMLKDSPEAISSGCLYHALAMYQLTGAPIVAGSYSWQFTTVDTGDNPTHFSCMFDERAKSLAGQILEVPEVLGTLSVFPEMHVWNSLEGKVLDISTEQLTVFAKRLCGFDFEPSLMPPEYLWDRAHHKKFQWKYDADPLATRLARAAAEQLMSHFPRGEMP